jgi:hypothetical protein
VALFKCTVHAFIVGFHIINEILELVFILNNFGELTCLDPGVELLFMFFIILIVFHSKRTFMLIEERLKFFQI